MKCHKCRTRRCVEYMVKYEINFRNYKYRYGSVGCVLGGRGRPCNGDARAGARAGAWLCGVQGSNWDDIGASDS